MNFLNPPIIEFSIGTRWGGGGAGADADAGADAGAVEAGVVLSSGSGSGADVGAVADLVACPDVIAVFSDISHSKIDQGSTTTSPRL